MRQGRKIGACGFFCGVYCQVAMGKPTWVLLKFDADWRWLLERRDSPWYPSMRLFRQARGETWPSVIERVTRALEAQVALWKQATSTSLDPRNSRDNSAPVSAE